LKTIPKCHSCQRLLVLAGLFFATLLAKGAIVYRHFDVPMSNGIPIVIGLPSNPYLLDMDNDGSTDLIFQSSSQGFAVFPQSRAAVVAAPAGPLDSNSYALPLGAGISISSLAPVGAFWDTDEMNGSLLTSAQNNGAIGLFTGQIAYLGVQFTRGGQLHFGYLHLDTSFVGLNTGNLLALAWETTPGLAISAGAVPEPPEPPLIITSIARENSNTTALKWNSVIGRVYQVDAVLVG
jgi:hypothetical protein